MAADSVGGQMLIGLAADHKLPQKVMPFVEEAIFKNPSSVVRVQATKYFKRAGGKVYSIADIAKMPADAPHGKMVFTTRCASCHKAGNEGNTIGPDLTGIAKKFDRTELLDNIVNPNASIVFGYEPWLITTKGGESLYGFLLQENKQTVVIKDISGQKHVTPVKDIVSRQKQQQSLMPDPISNGLTEQDLADVVKYLQSVVK
jgi:putative heme-binding domain-containing protein